MKRLTSELSEQMKKGKELDSLLSQGEGFNLEFKESLDKSIGKEICALFH